MISFEYLIIVLVIVIVLVIIYLKKEHFMENNITNVTIHEFNNIFDANLVILPKFCYAIGIENNNFYLYSESDTITTINRINFLLKYWYENIHPKLKNNKYYFVYCYNDGFRERIKYYHGKLRLYNPSFYEFKDKLNDTITLITESVEDVDIDLAGVE